METTFDGRWPFAFEVAMSPADFLDYAAKQIVAKGWSLREIRGRGSAMG